MDRIEETTNVIKQLNKFNSNQITNDSLVKSVCDYFDLIKSDNLNQSDLKFLKYLSNAAGIPHYYDLLENFNQKTEIENFDLNTFSSLLYESVIFP